MRVAITGHRSEDCEERAVRRSMRAVFDELQPSTVIVGMANGTDLWAGDTAVLMGLDVWAAKPWKGHGPRVADRELYARVIEGAARVVNVDESESYQGPWLYHKRNEWMVDHCDVLVAYWSGKESGGTFACVNYAKKKGVKVVNVYDG